jgi:acylphosphatase
VTTPLDHARLEAWVRRRVQGVGLRYTVIRQSRQYGHTGWVANEADGSVHCVVEGPRADLERLLADLQAGPPSAIVERVDTRWSGAIGDFALFGIRSGAHRGD